MVMLALYERLIKFCLPGRQGEIAAECPLVFGFESAPIPFGGGYAFIRKQVLGLHVQVGLLSGMLPPPSRSAICRATLEISS